MDPYNEYLQELADVDTPLHPTGNKGAHRKRSRSEIVATLIEPSDGSEAGFNPSFHSSRHEREWIMTYLKVFYEDQQITDVLRQVKGGKEATVYCCRAHVGLGGGLIAAKVYRPRMFRNLRNDSVYRAGRATLDAEGKATHGTREGRALANKTRFGQNLRHLSWLSNEFSTLELLHKAGLDVPEPFADSANAILMEYLGDEEQVAPTLNNVSIAAAEARPLFDRLIWNVAGMLDHNRVHGDLSAHNILYWEGELRIIDFPQAVSPFENPNAFELFTRDVTRVCSYFARHGVDRDPSQLATDLWRTHQPTAPLPGDLLHEAEA